jgi:hypothetical protein
MRVPMSPYPPGEFVGMVWRRFTGPSPRPQPGPRTLRLHDAPPTGWIGFVGDICPLFGRTPHVAPGVQAFFDDCALVVGNFEGILTDRAWRPFLMRHTPATFAAMAKVKPLDRWIVSVANNHASDYGRDGLNATVRALEARGLRWCGTADRPRCDLGPEAPGAGGTVTAWTWWLNRPADYVATADPGAPDGPGLHVACPHWGYEHERTPRPTQTRPPGYAVTAGHHSHLPQPVEPVEAAEVAGETSLVAWSLGNFITGKRLPVLGEGRVLKVGVALGAEGAPVPVRAAVRDLTLERSADRCVVRLRSA